MKIDIITCLPKLLEGPFNCSIIQRAKDKKIVEINIHNLREYSNNKFKKVDDYPYGGAPGMLLTIEPIVNCLEYLQSKNIYDEIIYLTPDGELLNQSISNKYSTYKNIILICGHYKGIDQRVRDHFITKEISIGKYVISGGELAAAVFTDSVVRLLPGSLSNSTSAMEDTYQLSDKVSPQYTRPYNFRGYKVPKILLSGNHKKIQKWKDDHEL